MQAPKLPFSIPEESRHSLEVCYANTTWASLMSYDGITVQGVKMQQMFKSAIAEKCQRKCYLPKMCTPFP